jgi:hypothetical protein
MSQIISVSWMLKVSRCLPAALLGFGLGLTSSAAWSQSVGRLSGPYTHQNLSVYLVHGPSAQGPVPLTLQEAMGKGSVRVIETGSVNELQIENTGGEDIFIQSGDIVKGGKQDRVLMVSLLLPPKSGKVPISSFCVEQGRWTARGKENVTQFASSSDVLPSREAKLAMKAPIAKPLASAGPISSGGAEMGAPRNVPRQGGHDFARDETSVRQKGVWDEVAKTQDKLSANLGARVAAPQSATSLQLSLENDALKAMRVAYVTALSGHGRTTPDAIGYVFAINGQINSADVYPSSELFKKMWDKLLNASVTEAIGDTRRAASQTGWDPVPPPMIAAVDAFLASAETGASDEKRIATLMVQETRDASGSLYVEARRVDGRWVHRNYLAK